MKPSIQYSIRNTPYGSFCFVIMAGSEKIAESVDYPTHAECCQSIRDLRDGGSTIPVVDTTREGKLNPVQWA